MLVQSSQIRSKAISAVFILMALRPRKMWISSQTGFSPRRHGDTEARRKAKSYCGFARMKIMVSSSRRPVRREAYSSAR